jgi:hypothetical protein
MCSFNVHSPSTTTGGERTSVEHIISENIITNAAGCRNTILLIRYYSSLRYGEKEPEGQYVRYLYILKKPGYLNCI